MSVSPSPPSIPESKSGCGRDLLDVDEVVRSEVAEEVLAHGDDDAEDDGEYESQEPDVEPIRAAPAPELPSQAEVDEH